MTNAQSFVLRLETNEKKWPHIVATALQQHDNSEKIYLLARVRPMVPVPQNKSRIISEPSPLSPADSPISLYRTSACFVLVWKKELADIWNVSPLNISVMVGFPYKVYSSSPTDVLPTDVFTLFMILTYINTTGISIL
jgi:hypothetical protein